MELLNHLRSVDKVGSRFPSPFTHLVTLLMNKILQLFTVEARIKDLKDFEFFFAINLGWLWRYLQPTWNS